MSEWDGTERRDVIRARGRDKCESCEADCAARRERAFHDPCSGCACRAFVEAGSSSAAEPAQSDAQ